MNDLLPVYAIYVRVLCLKGLAISCYHGFFRIRDKAFINRERAALFSRTPPASVDTQQGQG